MEANIGTEKRTRLWVIPGMGGNKTAPEGIRLRVAAVKEWTKRVPAKVNECAGGTAKLNWTASERVDVAGLAVCHECAAPFVCEMTEQYEALGTAVSAMNSLCLGRGKARGT